MKKYEIFFCGVGGQGILTITDIVCNAANSKNINVRGSETHGMAQRGGSVVAHMRIGSDVHSPLISPGEADLLIALEPDEALRFASFVKPDSGYIVTNTATVSPTTLSLKKIPYPSVEEILKTVRKFCDNVISFNATELAIKAGSARSTNVVLLGAASAIPGFPFDEEVLINAMKIQFKPKIVELNKKALIAGKEVAQSFM